FREVPGGPYHQSIVDCEGCRFSLGHQWSERFQDLGFATVLFSNDRIGELPLIIRPSLDRNDSYVESTVRAGGIGPAMAHAIRETGKLNIAKALVLLHPYYKGHNTSEEFEVKVLRFAYFLDQIGLKYGIEDVAGFALLFARMNSEYRATLRDIITDSRMLELAREEIKWISKYMAVLIETMPIDQLYFFNFELSPRNTLQERFDRVIELVRTYAKVNGLLKGEQTDSVLGLDTGETKGQ
ncbi:hypothetical protein HYT84_04685, partial [Candidatus Micrarchaeota archaeon]|nr:hypothetical protein [Candidatus Micrarchaeota archaeon]